MRGRLDLQNLILRYVNSCWDRESPTQEQIFTAVVLAYPKAIRPDVNIVRAAIRTLMSSGDLLHGTVTLGAPKNYSVSAKGLARLVEAFDAQAIAVTRLESMPDVAKLLATFSDSWDGVLAALLVLYEKQDYVGLPRLYQLCRMGRDNPKTLHNPEQLGIWMENLSKSGLITLSGQSYKITDRGSLFVESLSLIQHGFTDTIHSEKEAALASS